MRKELWYIVGGVSVSTLLVGLVSGGLFAAPVLTLPKQIRAAPACFDDTNRYVACGNGTVTDTLTGLIWLANANCFGTETYENANTMAAELADGACGLTDGSVAGDWRLATIAEWQTTIALAVAVGCTAPGSPPSLTNTAGTACFSTEASPVFSGVQPSNYWSSTTFAPVPGVAQSVFLSGGVTNASTRTSTYFVWPVRDGR